MGRPCRSTKRIWYYQCTDIDHLQAEPKFDAVILTVAHQEFISLDIQQFLKDKSVVYDVKGTLKEGVDGRL